MEKIIEKAKELGQLIKENERTKKMQLAELAINSDTELQNKINEFTELRNRMMGLMEKGMDDKSIIEPLNLQIKTAYDEIMNSKAMVEYNEAKGQFEEIMNNVNGIIQFYVTGEQPGCDPSSCASCGGGCH